MIRAIIAAWLLRNMGAKVRYVVRRQYANVKGRGTSTLTTSKLSEARDKYRSMRVADTDTITITAEAIMAQRHGTVAAKGSLSKKENQVARKSEPQL